jgi:hypothetical protein
MTVNKLRIDANIIQVMVNDDPQRVIAFDPGDVTFAERFYLLLRNFEEKQAQYEARAHELDAKSQELDSYGLPANLGESLAFLREVCTFMREQIDTLFGAGTSQTAFGESLSLQAIGQFFDGIIPFVQKARAGKLEKYSTPKSGRRVMKG